MIYPMSFYWRQFLGTQITAIFHGLWLYFKETYDDILEYFRNWSMDTCTNEHLTLCGILRHLSRPYLNLPDERLALFTSVYGYTDNENPPPPRVPDVDYPSEQGTAEVNGDIGGKFDTVEGIGMNRTRPVSERIYRILLQALRDSSGRLGSLIALDDMIYSQSYAKQRGEQSIYQINIMQEDEPGSYLKGFVQVKLVDRDAYIYITELFAELQLLGKTVYFPRTTLFADI